MCSEPDESFCIAMTKIPFSLYVVYNVNIPIITKYEETQNISTGLQRNDRKYKTKQTNHPRLLGLRERVQMIPQQREKRNGNGDSTHRQA